MNKYAILIILNTPIILLGLLKAYTMFATKVVSRGQFIGRVLFWLSIATCIIFAKPIYNFLQTHNLTDTTPLTLADVFLISGVLLCFLLCVRLYSRIDALEKRLADVHQGVSIKISEEIDNKRK